MNYRWVKLKNVHGYEYNGVSHDWQPALVLGDRIEIIGVQRSYDADDFKIGKRLKEKHPAETHQSRPAVI